MLERKQYLEFNFREFLLLAIVIITFGSFATSWNLANNQNLTPENTFSQIWASTIMYLITLSLFFLIGAIYYKLRKLEDDDLE